MECTTVFTKTFSKDSVIHKKSIFRLVHVSLYLHIIIQYLANENIDIRYRREGKQSRNGDSRLGKLSGEKGIYKAHTHIYSPGRQVSCV